MQRPPHASNVREGNTVDAARVMAVPRCPAMGPGFQPLNSDVAICKGRGTEHHPVWAPAPLRAMYRCFGALGSIVKKGRRLPAIPPNPWLRGPTCAHYQHQHVRRAVGNDGRSTQQRSTALTAHPRRPTLAPVQVAKEDNGDPLPNVVPLFAVGWHRPHAGRRLGHPGRLHPAVVHWRIQRRLRGADRLWHAAGRGLDSSLGTRQGSGLHGRTGTTHVAVPWSVLFAQLVDLRRGRAGDAALFHRSRTAAMHSPS